MTDQVTKDLQTLAAGFALDRDQAGARIALVDVVIEELQRGETPAAQWAFPVGTDEHPAKHWYVYTHHDLTGRRNPQSYGHTGIDLNGDWRDPDTGEFRGNVDIGQPVFAVADGEVVSVGWSERFRGGVVIKTDHYGVPLYVRYWHCMRGPSGWWQVGDTITTGEWVGQIDRYPGGYAHCHLDMAWQPFEHNWWFTYHPKVEWTNPTYILKAHLDPAQVDEMVAKGN